LGINYLAIKTVVVRILLLSESGSWVDWKLKMNTEVKKPPLSTERKNAGAKQGELTNIVGVGIVHPTKLANTHGDLTSPKGSSANEEKHTSNNSWAAQPRAQRKNL
jgi:hypothetical protein